MNKIVTAISLISLTGLLLQCGSGSGIAGGTGVGNPPVVAASFHVVADTSAAQELGKTVASLLSSRSAQLWAPPMGAFPIVDDGDLSLTVDSAVVVVESIFFIVDSAEECGSLLAEHAGPLSCDSNGILLPGPFVFNALSGECDPPLDSLLLPQANYTGVKLFLKDQAGDSTPGGVQMRTAIYLAGEFFFADSLRRFSMQLGVNSLSRYLLPAGTILDTASGSAFVLQLRAAHWLDSVDLQPCIIAGNLPLSSDGSLEIAPMSGAGPCRGVEGQIRRNVVNSGVLELY
jgi:hypothetical protein